MNRRDPRPESAHATPGEVAYSTVPVHETLPSLLRERRLSIRALARDIEVHPSHLSRVMRQSTGKRVSGQLATRIALALGLRHDYFPEARLDAVERAVRNDPILRDGVYRRELGDEIHAASA
ncbi:MAG TPA: hypothetical protein PKB03_00680 [Baekduia sp.]|nr:hypothetical protein [Baekduia sp.]